MYTKAMQLLVRNMEAVTAELATATDQKLRADLLSLRASLLIELSKREGKRNLWDKKGRPKTARRSKKPSNIALPDATEWDKKIPGGVIEE